MLLATHREINLQNMQSIATAFREYFGYKRTQDEVYNDILLSHACRHVIVHCGAIADRKMTPAVVTALPPTPRARAPRADHPWRTRVVDMRTGSQLWQAIRD